MEGKDKKTDNKKLTKILVFSGIGLLFLFIVLRLSFKASQDNVIDGPQLNDPEYANVKLPDQKSNLEKENDIKRKEQQEKEKYINQDFGSAFVLKKDSNVIKSTTKIVESSNPSQQNVPDNTPKFQSKVIEDYNKQSSVEQKQIVSEPVENKDKKVTKPTFGTMKAENKNSTVKQRANESSFKGTKAEIYGDQKIAEGGGVIIRNKTAITYKGIEIPANSILKGKAVYNGNRVKMSIHKAETKNGNFNVDLYVLDNDNIEGVFYKAPIDEVKDGKTDQVIVPGKYSGVISNAVNKTVDGVKELAKKSRSLELEDGYIIYIMPNEK